MHFFVLLSIKMCKAFVDFSDLLLHLCCSVAKFCLTLCDPLDNSMTGFPVLQHLPEFAQTHVLWVHDAIPPSYPHSPSSPALRLSQHQDLFSELALCIRWLKYWSFSFSISPSNKFSELISFRIDRYDLLAVKGLSRVFSSTTVRVHQCFGAQPSLWSKSHIHTWLLEKPVWI